MNQRVLGWCVIQKKIDHTNNEFPGGLVIGSFIHSSYKCLLSDFGVLGAGDTAMHGQMKSVLP